MFSMFSIRNFLDEVDTRNGNPGTCLAPVALGAGRTRPGGTDDSRPAIRGTRIGVSACRRIGVSRQARRLSYFFLMGTDHPLNRHAHTPMRPYADPSPP